MAFYAVLPDCDFGSGDTGRRIRHPTVGMNQMRGGDTVVFFNGRGDRPDQTFLENVFIRLHPGAECAVKRKFCIGVCFPSGGESFYHERPCKPDHKVTADSLIFADLKEDGGSFRNPQLKGADVNFLGKDCAFSLRLFGAAVRIDGSDFATLAVQKSDFLLGQTVLAGQVSSVEVGINFVANDPFKILQMVLKRVMCLHFGIDAKEKPIRVFCHGRRGDRGQRCGSLFCNVSCTVSISACHNLKSPFCS